MRDTRIRWFLRSHGVRPAMGTGVLERWDALCCIADTPFEDRQLSRIEAAMEGREVTARAHDFRACSPPLRTGGSLVKASFDRRVEPPGR